MTALERSLQYLASERAIENLKANAYWPKWDSPWWHLTLLHEMGQDRAVPRRAVQAMIGALRASPLTIFPIHPGDLPAGLDLSLGTHCHCALGNIYQALAGALEASGDDPRSLDRELPWIRPWFLRYQLPDGGLNCDGDAYLKTPPPSSMVGTIAPLEAMLLHSPGGWTEQEGEFLDRGARCLLERRLLRADPGPHNPEEREDEADWLKPCFPRFYFYDVLRGLSFALKWSEARRKPLPLDAIRPAFDATMAEFPDGRVRVLRRPFEGVTTRLRPDRRAGVTPLLDEVSRIGEVSPYLSAEWRDARARFERLRAQGLIVVTQPTY